MPYYRFLVHGADPALPEGARGFYTTRHMFGANEAAALRKLLAKLEVEYTRGVSAYVWRAGPPVFSVEDAWRIGLHQLCAAPNKGSAFYDERD